MSTRYSIRVEVWPDLLLLVRFCVQGDTSRVETVFFIVHECREKAVVPVSVWRPVPDAAVLVVAHDTLSNSSVCRDVPCCVFAVRVSPSSPQASASLQYVVDSLRAKVSARDGNVVAFDRYSFNREYHIKENNSSHTALADRGLESQNFDRR